MYKKNQIRKVIRTFSFSLFSRNCITYTETKNTMRNLKQKWKTDGYGSSAEYAQQK